jgi:hypothetical protein
MTDWPGQSEGMSVMRLGKRQPSFIAVEPPLHKWVRAVARHEGQADADWTRELLQRSERQEREREEPPDLRLGRQLRP